MGVDSQRARRIGQEPSHEEDAPRVDGAARAEAPREFEHQRARSPHVVPGDWRSGGACKGRGRGLGLRDRALEPCRQPLAGPARADAGV
jgi:hypothetical protein